jgi:hypothetical protein
MSSNVHIAGVGMTQFGRHLDRSPQSLGQEALDMVPKRWHSAEVG